MPRPLAASIRRCPAPALPAGVFASYSAVKRLARASRLPYGEVDDAIERVESLLMRGCPRDVKIEALSLGVA
jgi:hypothetical protein